MLIFKLIAPKINSQHKKRMKIISVKSHIFFNLTLYTIIRYLCMVCSLKHVLLSLEFQPFEAITLQRQIMSNDIPKLLWYNLSMLLMMLLPLLAMVVVIVASRLKFDPTRHQTLLAFDCISLVLNSLNHPFMMTSLHT